MCSNPQTVSLPAGDAPLSSSPHTTPPLRNKGSPSLRLEEVMILALVMAGWVLAIGLFFNRSVKIISFKQLIINPINQDVKVCYRGKNKIFFSPTDSMKLFNWKHQIFLLKWPKLRKHMCTYVCATHAVYGAKLEYIIILIEFSPSNNWLYE